MSWLRSAALATLLACAEAPPDAERSAPTPIVDDRGEIIGGWARSPLFRFDRDAIPRGARDRIRAWDFYSVFTPDFAVNVTLAELFLADLGPTVLASASFHDHGERPAAAGLILQDGRTAGLLPIPGGDYRVDDPGGTLALGHDAAGRRTITFDFGGALSGAVAVDAPTGDSVALVTPFAEPGHFFYENKVPGLAASGVVSIRGERLALPAGRSFAVLDWVRAVAPRTIDWTWATAAGRVDESVVALNLGTVFGDESAGTPNAVIVDGRLHKLGRVDWGVDLDDPEARWTFTAANGRVALVLEPVGTPETQDLELGFYAVHLTRPYGRFHGTVVLDDGRTLEVTDLVGAAEVNHIEW